LLQIARETGSGLVFLSKEFVIAILIITGLVRSESSWGAEESSRSSVTVERRKGPKDVTLVIQHGVELPWGKPGFRILVNHWRPHGEMSVYAIGPQGEKIELIPLREPIKADRNGMVVIDIDYGRKGLGRGHWLIMVAGKSGTHLIETDMP
jgi:hypothetical protein